MSRMRTSCASLSWARPAMRRACSIGVRVFSSPLGCRLSVATVEAETLDRGGHRRWHQVVDRLSASHARATLGGGARRRPELEAEPAVAEAAEGGGGEARARAAREPHP